jgi:hypothetical protein
VTAHVALCMSRVCLHVSLCVCLRAFVRLCACLCVRVSVAEVYPALNVRSPFAIDQSGGWKGRVLHDLTINFCDIPERDASLTAVAFFKEFYSQVHCRRPGAISPPVPTSALTLTLSRSRSLFNALLWYSPCMQSRPVIIRGAAKDWKFRKNWRSSKFLEKYAGSCACGRCPQLLLRLGGCAVVQIRW